MDDVESRKWTQRIPSTVFPFDWAISRWYHIVENHDEMASYYHDVLETIESPEIVVHGNNRSLKAARNLGKRLWLVVIYRETSRDDGFVITAYLMDSKPKRKVAWQRQ